MRGRKTLKAVKARDEVGIDTGYRVDVPRAFHVRTCAYANAWCSLQAIQPIHCAISFRHNELRDLTAQLLTETYHSVGTEPPLQPLGDEQLRHRTANRDDGARLDIVAEDFGGRNRHNAMLGCLINPYALRYRFCPNLQTK